MSNSIGRHAALSILFLCVALHAACALGGFVRSGVPHVIDSWTTDEGLPRNTVTSIVQTQDGYLWVGTPNGLVKYDGFKFEVFDTGNTPGLGSSSIVRLFEDRRGSLWVGTETAGVTLIQNGVATNFNVIQGGRRLSSICQDPSDAVWLYMADGQLWRYAGGRFQAFMVDGGRQSVCRSIITESSGPVWVATDKRQFSIGTVLSPVSINLPAEQNVPVASLNYLLSSKFGGYWRLGDGRIQKWNGNQLERDCGPYPWSRAPISAACEDIHGNLVVGTLGLGVFWLNPDNSVSWLATKQGLPNDVVLALCVDREENLWVGTDGGGLTRVKRQIFEVFDTASGLPGQPPQSVAEDRQGGLWIGFNGGGVGYWNKGATNMTVLNEGLTSMSVWSVLADRQDRVWAGTWGGGLVQWRDGRFEAAPGFENGRRIVPALFQDRKDNIWAGTQGGLACWDGKQWTVRTTKDGLSSDDIRAIAEDSEGGLWIGTMQGGLNYFKDGKFVVYHKKDGLPGEDIRSLYVDREGVLWIGTTENGLGRFYQGQWTHYSVRDGLHSNSIGWMTEDEQGWFWIASNMGVMRLEKRQLNDFARGASTYVTCRTYDKSDGLPTRECTMDSQPGGCLARDGRLWFPTVKGLLSVQVPQLKSNTNPPPVRVKSIYIDGQEQLRGAMRSGWSDLITVPAGKELLEIHFSSLNLAAPGKAQFKYRLEPFESKWKEAGNKLVAAYNKLSPGRYRFEVKACNEDGVWNETGASVALVFEPPFWRTWWFLGAASAVLLGSIIGVVYYLSTQKLQRQLDTMKQREALEKERSRIASDIHDQLGASLTHVAMLGELVEGDKDLPQEVEAHAKQITQTARDTTRILDEIVWAVNPSNDTLDSLMNYICKHAQEYLSVAGISCRLDVPSALPQLVLPPEYRHNIYLTFKESITNVVRHAAASNVLVRLTLDSQSLLLEIQDDGRGMAGMDERRARTRNGLSNMRKRMEAIGGSFSLSPAPEKGTVARLAAPLAKG